jgi:hypothetical protein
VSRYLNFFQCLKQFSLFYSYPSSPFSIQTRSLSTKPRHVSCVVLINFPPPTAPPLLFGCTSTNNPLSFSVNIYASASCKPIQSVLFIKTKRRKKKKKRTRTRSRACISCRFPSRRRPPAADVIIS